MNLSHNTDFYFHVHFNKANVFLLPSSWGHMFVWSPGHHVSSRISSLNYCWCLTEVYLHIFMNESAHSETSASRFPSSFKPSLQSANTHSNLSFCAVDEIFQHVCVWEERLMVFDVWYVSFIPLADAGERSQLYKSIQMCCHSFIQIFIHSFIEAKRVCYSYHSLSMVFVVNRWISLKLGREELLRHISLWRYFTPLDQNTGQ